MARKLKLTRPELKRHRDALARFERYLPMLKLKQQQLQLTIQQVAQKHRAAEEAAETARRRFAAYDRVLADRAGVNVRELAAPLETKTSTANVAGVTVPVFEDVVFAEPVYSLFATPAWVDRALADLKDLNRRQAEVDVIRRQHDLLHRELVKIIQRVNLFEKVKIPESREAIRRIRIHLGDEMTAAVGRAKIAKAKISEEDSAAAGDGPTRPVLAGAEEPPEP
jgi:V/A-type H+/Na+-transporting ATPase subunit D